jgi:hypothetical protein
MPDDNMSAEQEEQNDEMSIEEQEALFGQDESEIKDEYPDNNESEDQDEDTGDNDDDDDEEGADDEGGSDDDDEESDDEDEDDSDEEEDDDENEDDSDPLAEVKAQAAALKQEGQAAADKVTADAERAENMKVAKEEALKDLFSQDTIKIGDREVNLKELSEEYGPDLDTLITARAQQMTEAMIPKILESQGFASQAEVQAVKAENDHFRLISQIAQTHPDIWKLETDDKFWSWVDAQDEDVKTLMDQGGAPGISTVVGAYKKATITKTNAKIDKVAAEKKKKHTDLHSSTTRTKGGKKGGKSKKGGQMTEEEEAAVFDEIEVTD